MDEMNSKWRYFDLLKYIQQESKILILLVQRDVLADFNKIVSQNNNVMKLFFHIPGNMCWNHYLTFNNTGIKYNN